MTTLPPLFTARDPSRVQFALSEAPNGPSYPIEPGNWFDSALHDSGIANFPETVQATDVLPTGTFASTGVWRLTVVPILTPFGAAAADGIGEMYVEFTADGDTDAEVAAGLIAAITSGATPTSWAAADALNRFRSFVSAAEGAASNKVRLTALARGTTFTARVTGPAGGDSYTLTTITSVTTTTLKAGLYYALDTAQGTDGFDAFGQPYLKAVTSSTPDTQIYGPVMVGDGLKEVEPGYWCREYEAGSVVPYALYGHPQAYAEAAVSAANVAVYVRHTVDSTGALVPGLAADATQAAVGATANLWTGTPTAADTTLYQATIQVVNNLGVQLTEVISFTSGAGATATTITTGLKAALAARLSLAGLVTGSGTATFILTGPADGRAVTVASTGPGVLAWVETTAEVSTHTLFARDKFLRTTSRAGGAPVIVNA
jgi:hypothetical protein